MFYLNLIMIYIFPISNNFFKESLIYLKNDKILLIPSEKISVFNFYNPKSDKYFFDTTDLKSFVLFVKLTLKNFANDSNIRSKNIRDILSLMDNIFIKDDKKLLIFFMNLAGFGFNIKTYEEIIENFYNTKKLDVFVILMRFICKKFKVNFSLHNNNLFFYKYYQEFNSCLEEFEDSSGSLVIFSSIAHELTNEIKNGIKGVISLGKNEKSVTLFNIINKVMQIFDIKELKLKTVYDGFKISDAEILFSALNISNIEKIQLRNTGLKPGWFGKLFKQNLEKITNLDVSYNRLNIKDLKSFEKMVNCKYLNLSSCSFKIDSKNLMNEIICSCLKYCVLNDICCLPKKLEYLIFKNNQIIDLNLFASQEINGTLSLENTPLCISCLESSFKKFKRATFALSIDNYKDIENLLLLLKEYKYQKVDLCIDLEEETKHIQIKKIKVKDYRNIRNDNLETFFPSILKNNKICELELFCTLETCISLLENFDERSEIKLTLEIENAKNVNNNIAFFKKYSFIKEIAIKNTRISKNVKNFLMNLDDACKVYFENISISEAYSDEILNHSNIGKNVICFTTDERSIYPFKKLEKHKSIQISEIKEFDNGLEPTKFKTYLKILHVKSIFNINVLIQVLKNICTQEIILHKKIELIKVKNIEEKINRTVTKISFLFPDLNSLNILHLFSSIGNIEIVLDNSTDKIIKEIAHFKNLTYTLKRIKLNNEKTNNLYDFEFKFLEDFDYLTEITITPKPLQVKEIIIFKKLKKLRKFLIYFKAEIIGTREECEEIFKNYHFIKLDFKYHYEEK
ncbi:hypothetical protein H312_03037 [Anncaliia algerae PRA339]|uniref:Uncharacterized protein n=1 Tax=Anncaliia algerae PRA339 TaxID=1288291 RepID=A0A059EXF4_9MICR|nr:hypothetical protein H312_03037 [Anncaliia algerae PRA339]